MDGINMKSIAVTFSLLLIFVKRCESQNRELMEFRVKEEQTPGTFLGSISQKYNDKREGLRFILARPSHTTTDDLFEVDSVSGNITTTAVIDREALCQFTPGCVVRLEVAAQTNENFFDIIDVDIVIEDINDNSPTFSQQSVALSISEAVLTGGSLIIDGARDIDKSELFSLQGYSLEPQISGDALPFSVNFVRSLDGGSKVKIIVNEILDRETRDSYRFFLLAKDGGSPPKQGSMFVTVNVTDVNDNYPQFNKASYAVNVNEEVVKGTVILTVLATDNDIGTNGIVRYRLSLNQHADNLRYFAMDDLSGKLSIKEVLNTTNKRYFKLIVDALDQGNSPLLSQTSVEVTVLDTSNSAPRIKPTLTPNPSNSFASISEYADVGAAVAHIGVEDLDSGRNGDVDCFLLNADSMFQLNKYATNEYKVTVDKSLDRETKPSHDVTITCTDKGVPPLSTMYSFEVRVSDENDNAPMFRQQRYFVNFNENNEIGDQIVIVSAFDMDSGNNSKLTFYLDARSQSYAFINERTGEILANRKFDKEAPDGQGLSLTVYARDQGNPVLSGSASVLVTIQDVNDEKPVFDQAHFRFWIDENRPADETVGKLSATDKDLGSNAVTRFTMKPNGSNIPFVVIEDGSIKTNRELDREDRAQYTFEVMAIDIGNEALFSTATVTVFVSDMNDNSPVVTFPRSGNSTVYVQYLTAPQTVVCRVLAEDKDDPNTANGRMRYSLTTMNSTNFFSIDASNGNVILKAPLENTNSIGKTYILNIQVTDQGNGTHYVQSTLHVVIVSDNGTQALTEEPSKNFVIVVVVSVATVLISVAIIVTICIIRRFDRSRRGITKGHQKVMTDSMYARNNEEVDNIFPADACEVEKKKKGVHFNIEGQSGIQGHVDCQIAQNNDDHGNHSFDHLVLEPPPQYQLNLPRSKLDDCHSDMSGESAGDSGKGGSDDDLQINNLSFPRDGDLRFKDRWNTGRHSASACQLSSFPTRYTQPNNTLTHQKIVPFSFKKTPSYSGNGLINNLAPQPSSQMTATTGYSVPTYYDDESRSSSGFHSSIDSSSNMHINNFRNGKLYLNRAKVSDCVV